MSTVSIPEQLPTGAIAVVLALLLLSFGYSVVVMGSPFLWLLPWLAVLSLFVVYLLYRLVVAVETIADER